MGKQGAATGFVVVRREAERVGREGGSNNTCKTQQTEAEIEITSDSHGNIEIRCDKQRMRERERERERVGEEEEQAGWVEESYR